MTSTAFALVLGSSDIDETLDLNSKRAVVKKVGKSKIDDLTIDRSTIVDVPRSSLFLFLCFNSDGLIYDSVFLRFW